MRIGASLSHGGDADLAAIEAADAAAQMLGDQPCRLAVVFTTSAHADALAAVGATVHARLRPQALLGAVAQGVVGPVTEVEQGPAVSVWCAGWPDGTGSVEPFHAHTMRLAEGAAAVVGWPDTTSGDVTLVLADPHSFPAGEVVSRVSEARPGHRLVGGLLTPGAQPGRLLYGSGETLPRVVEHGAVGAVLQGLPVDVVVSQGCRPVGEPLVVTAADGNLILGLAGEPAAERVRQLIESAPPEERLLMQRGLQLGIVADEYRDHFQTGDFLIRSVLGADPDSGAVAVGELIHVGQTVQFQVRDAGSAHEDLVAALKGRARSAGALLFTCNGRGRRFFGEADHDARVVGELVSPQLAGAFCAGEIGPVGLRSYLHGFTASLAVFHED